MTTALRRCGSVPLSNRAGMMQKDVKAARCYHQIIPAQDGEKKSQKTHNLGKHIYLSFLYFKTGFWGVTRQSSFIQSESVYLTFPVIFSFLIKKNIFQVSVCQSPHKKTDLSICQHNCDGPFLFLFSNKCKKKKKFYLIHTFYRCCFGTICCFVSINNSGDMKKNKVFSPT